MGRIGIDVGGTFTDAVIVDDAARIRIAKVRSTPAQIEAGFIDGLRELLERAAAAPSSVDYLAHGSTVATNAIVQRRLARTALVTNRGLPRRAGHRHADARARLRPVDAGARAGGAARAVPRGRRPARRAGRRRRRRSTRRACGARRRRLRDERVEAVAVMLLFSFANPAHEERVGAHPGRGAARRAGGALLPRGARVPRVRAGLDDGGQRGAAAAARRVRRRRRRRGRRARACGCRCT